MSYPDLQRVQPVHFQVARPSRIFWHVAALLIVGLAIAFVNPRGFIGGGYDDGRYLAAATKWATEGPNIGYNHWALRWPLVLPMAGLLRLFGPNHAALLIPGLVSYLALGLVNYLGVRAAASERAALIAGIGILATPGFAYWATALYPDHMEAALWSAAFWSLWQATHVAAERAQSRWMIAAGVSIGLAVCVRETSVVLAPALVLAALFLPRLSSRAWLWGIGAAAALPVAEYAILWAATGDPIHRLHVSLRHIAIPSEDLRGMAANGQLAVLNATIMERWSGAGPVHLHWLVDTYINFVANFYYGLSFAAAAALAMLQRRVGKQQGGSSVVASQRGLIPALLVVAAANVVFNLYILALNPSTRMFVSATIVATIVMGILADRLWSRWVRRAIVALLVVRIFASVIVADTAPSYERGGEVARQIAPPGRIHVSWQTHAHLALADASLRRRLDMSTARTGDYLLAFSNHGAPITERVSPGRWRFVRAGQCGHNPWAIRLVHGILHALAVIGVEDQLTYGDVEVRLFQRLPGPATEFPVVVLPDGEEVVGTSRLI